MSEPESFSIKEMLQRVEEKLDVNTQLTTDLNLKVGLQNGRVTTQEKWSAEAKIIIESNAKSFMELDKTVSNYKWWGMGVIAAMGLVGYFALKTIVRDTVETALQNTNQSYK